MLRSINVAGMLSFRDASLELRPLNVLIGPNGSGKSNLIEIVALLQAAPRGLVQFFGKGGGIAEWLWKGERAGLPHEASGQVDVVIDHPHKTAPLRYSLRVTARDHRLEILNERLEYEKPSPGKVVPYYFFQVENGFGQIKINPNDVAENENSMQGPRLTPRCSHTRPVGPT
jgi:predicted ATPase